MKDTLTSFDIFVLCRELNAEIRDYYIDNVYQLGPQTLLLKLNKPSAPAKQLMIQAERRLHLTNYEVRKPPRPSSFCQALRKYLVNCRAREVKQVAFDRVVRISVGKPSASYELVVEVFSRGNIVLVDAEGKIIHALNYRKMRDRTIARGEPYTLPPSLTPPLDRLELQAVNAIRKIEGDAVRSLVKTFGIPGIYAEEALRLAGIEKTAKASGLSELDLRNLHDALKRLFRRLEHPEPQVILDQQQKPLDVVPFKLSPYVDSPSVSYPSMNEAVDHYFTQRDAELEVRGLKSQVLSRLSELERILGEQKARLEVLQTELSHNLAVGETIKARSWELGSLLKWAAEKLESGAGPQGLVEEAKRLGVLGSPYLLRVVPQTKELTVKVGNRVFTLNPKVSIFENASAYFDRAKRLKEKIASVRDAITKTEASMEDVRAEELKVRAEAPKRLREKRWFEKYRFFTSSDGFLVVAGKDSSSNEALIKRHTQPNDVVLHAEIQGAPFAVVKTEGKTPTESTLFEAAQFEASYSRAWREGLESADVYWVRPDQLSKSPPPGQFLGRGAFMIYGKRNYIPGVPLRLAVGVKLKEGDMEVLCGPPSAIKAAASSWVQISPGRKEGRSLAQAIKASLALKAPQEYKEKILTLANEAILALIPFRQANIIY